MVGGIEQILISLARENSIIRRHNKMRDDVVTPVASPLPMAFSRKTAIIFVLCMTSMFYSSVDCFCAEKSYRKTPITGSKSLSWRLCSSSSSTQETTVADANKDDDESNSDNDGFDSDDSNSDAQSNFFPASNLEGGYFGRNSNGYSIDSGYSRFLYTKEQKKRVRKLRRRTKNNNKDDLNEDGYADMQGRNKSFFQKVVRLPFKAAKKIFRKNTVEPGTLILVRHGESEWNKNKTFTGT